MRFAVAAAALLALAASAGAAVQTTGVALYWPFIAGKLSPACT